MQGHLNVKEYIYLSKCRSPYNCPYAILRSSPS